MTHEFIVQCMAFAAGLAVGGVATAAVMQMEIIRLRSDVTELMGAANEALNDAVLQERTP